MAEQAQAGNSQKKKKAFIIVGMVVAIGLIAGWFYTNYGKTHISTDDAFIDGNIHTIAARINGTVKAVLVNDNQEVKKGDLLVEIDPADYEARLRESTAALGVEKAKFAEAETKIASARANLELAQANLKLAGTKKTGLRSSLRSRSCPGTSMTGR